MLVAATAVAYGAPVVLLDHCYDQATFSQTWKAPLGEWMVVGDTFSDPKDEKLLASKPGEGVAMNGATGKTTSLLTNKEFRDIELTVDFMVPKGSNSGVYLQGRYEIQILDSFGVEHPKYGDCGGIYQRWKEEPGLDDSQRGYEGHAPLTNASKKPGDWQTFRAVFRAPRFDAGGKKTANARFEKVWLNDVLVQDNVEVTGPTRAAHFNDEKPLGPIMLQGDHGPVAFRNLKITSLDSR
jgi:hypothetical protein